MRPQSMYIDGPQCSSTIFEQILDRHNIAATASGVIVFPVTMSVFQHCVWKKLNQAAHLRLAGLYGFVSVCASAVTSIFVVESVHNFSYGMTPLFALSYHHLIISLSLAVFQFTMLARSFKVLLPSHILHPGAYARRGIKLTNYMVKVTNLQRKIIQHLGYRYGCHTCGKKFSRIGNIVIKHSFLSKLFPSKIKAAYFADHSPPLALALNKTNHCKIVRGTLYPHCQNCSNFQAAQVRLAKNNTNKSNLSLFNGGMVTHTLRFRWWKLFLPWPLFVNHLESAGQTATNYLFSILK